MPSTGCVSVEGLFCAVIPPVAVLFVANLNGRRLDNALNELGLEGWEIVQPIYGPVDNQSGSGLEALILMNQRVNSAEELRAKDLDRRVRKAKKHIAEQQARLEKAIPDSSDYRGTKLSL